MGVSKNNGTPKSSILIEFSIINHPFWGTPIFGNTHIDLLAFVSRHFTETPPFEGDNSQEGWKSSPFKLQAYEFQIWWSQRLKDLLYILELPPTQDASDHQDYEPFLIGNPELNLHLWLLLGGG